MEPEPDHAGGGNDIKTGATARGRLGDGAGLGPKSRSAAAGRWALGRWPWTAILTGAGALAAWEGAVLALCTPAYILPSPSRVAVTLVAEAPLLWRDALTTGAEMLGGLLLGTLAGIAVALVRFRPVFGDGDGGERPPLCWDGARPATRARLCAHGGVDPPHARAGVGDRLALELSHAGARPLVGVVAMVALRRMPEARKIAHGLR